LPITLISGQDSGQSDGFHSANFAEDVLESTNDNIPTKTQQKTTEFVRDVLEIHLQTAAILDTRNWRENFLQFLLVKNNYSHHAAQSLLRFLSIIIIGRSLLANKKSR